MDAAAKTVLKQILDNDETLLQELSTGSAAAIFQEVSEIHQMLQKRGVETRPYTQKALHGLHHSDETKKQRILTDLKNWKNILISSESETEKDYSNVDECRLAYLALKYFNFMIKNKGWIEATHHDEIIEIYTPEGIQLYRSLNFFKTCGYSLLDLYVNEWFILWERSSVVIEKIHEVVEQTLKGLKTDTKVGIGPHLIRETYDDGTTQPFEPRTAVVTFGDIYPAFSTERPDEIIGFMVTSKGRVISVGDEALTVDFI